MALIPYPTEFPKEALAMALEAIRGDLPPTQEAAHAAWVVAGYALAQTIGGGPIVSSGYQTDEEMLEAALQQEPQPGVSQGIFPWAMVAQIVIRLILEKFGE
ncbi:MAG: hypothetical protein EBR82_35945 [Caulobacteraceae bacterium]|nr:hypothetical protein [Caulobacteraceae bacterium]